MFILSKLFGLLLFGFLVRQLLWREIEWKDFCFCNVMQLERGLFTTKSWEGGNLGQFLQGMCRWPLRTRIVFFGAYCRPYFCYFWGNVNFVIRT